MKQQVSRAHKTVDRAVAPAREKSAPGRSSLADPNQRAFGNQAAQRMGVAPTIQPKLAVSSPGDAFEQEADRVASAVLSASPTPPSMIHRADAATRGSADVPTVQPGLENKLASGGGGGRPLSQELRGFFEPRFGRDLGGVRVHNDAESAAAAKELNAHAFTHGQDIYFAGGQYQPHSDSGRRLIAHELTHTLQQSESAPAPARSSGPGIQRAATHIIQRDEAPPPAAPAAAPAMDLATGVLDEAAETLTFENIEVPSFKLAAHRKTIYDSRKPLKQKKNYQRGEPDQRTFWKNELSKDSTKIIEKLTDRYKTATKEKTADPAQQYVFKAPSGRYLIGNMQTVAKEITTPNWTLGGDFKSFDVDHILELQLANWDDDGWANTLPNMELLDSSLNRSSGSTIKSNINKKLSKFITATKNYYKKSEAELKSSYTLQFNAAVKGGGESATKDDFWKADDIRDGKHITKKMQVEKAADLGGDGKVLVFPSESGGNPKQFAEKGGVSGKDAAWLEPYRITSATFVTDNDTSTNFGSLTFVLPQDHPQWYDESGEQPISLNRIPGAKYAGWIDKSAVRSRLSSLRKKGASPVQIGTFDLLPDRGIYVSGQIKPDIKFLQGVSIDFEMSGGDLTLSKQFTVDDIKVPKPFEVRACTLTISVGTGIGLKVDGQVDFAIQRVGEGYLKGSAGTSEGLGLEGSFNFDSDLFSEAKATVKYEDDKWSATGKLAIEEGKVTGIKKADADISYENEVFKASGSAELNVPGVQQGRMEVVYSEADGLKVGGKFDLTSDIPGIRGGSVEAEVQQAGDGWKVKATGTAKPALPGFDTELTVSYDDGIITAQATAGFSRGMIAGNLTLGATNQAVDEQGNPTGAASESLTAFGNGQVTITFTPWLKGEVGIRVKPEGGIILSGTVALPSTFDLFPEKKLQKNLLTVGLDIPIVGVAVAGQRIGIFATIKGGLDAEAGFGPGQLRDTHVTVVYDPEDESATEVSGSAEFYVPAHAGLRLFVRGGLGAGIPIVSATANLEVGGQIGIEGAARAAVDVSWTPSEGVDLTAEAELSAQPKFKFDVTGSVLVEADILVDTIELYSKKWQLASFEYGSDLTFGVKFPIHYKNGELSDISVDALEFEIPDVDPGAILEDLVAQIA